MNYRKPKTSSAFAKLKQINLVFSILAGICLCFFVFSLNRVTAMTYNLRDAKVQSEEMGRLNRDLEQQKLQLESYASLQERVKSLGMVAIENIDYINDQSGPIAKR
jgi:hypothetical protein